MKEIKKVYENHDALLNQIYGAMENFLDEKATQRKWRTWNAGFNCFREQEQFDAIILLQEDEDSENFVLKNNNLASVKFSPEFITNKTQTI